MRLPLVALLLLTSTLATPPANDRVRPNDNRAPAGTLRDGVLTLRLEARLGEWHPDGDDAPGVLVPAFAEAGRAPQIPGPLVRVPMGTEVVTTVRNTLTDTLLLYGLYDRAGGAAQPPLVLAPDASRDVRFRLGAPGTYYYWGTTTHRALDYRTLIDAQLTGAIVVDSVPNVRLRDRIFVIGMWTDTVARAFTERKRLLAVINGRAWPNTERLSYGVGDTVRWRLVNASADGHPMHLHGFYFRVDARGDAAVDTTYTIARADSVVTDWMVPGATASIAWTPERAGNWLYHCHIPEHFAHRAALGAEPPPASHGHRMAHHALDGMGGLVLGVRVNAAPHAQRVARAPDGPRRHLRLVVRQNVGPATGPLFGYAVQDGATLGTRIAPDSGLHFGPSLVLRRGEPVRITVVNALDEPTAVHWHGIELESFFDGVAGFSGGSAAGQGRVTPVIAPRDSFEARFTPPRAGTFIYHTHVDEQRQQAGGLAGALLVVDSVHPYNPQTDRVVLITSALGLDAKTAPVLVNDSAPPAPLSFRVGVPYHLRFINMTLRRAVLWLDLKRGDSTVAWRPVAKDGADYNATRRVPTRATRLLAIGETYDVEYTPDQPGELRLQMHVGLRAPPRPLLTTIPIRVMP